MEIERILTPEQIELLLEVLEYELKMFPRYFSSHGEELLQIFQELKQFSLEHGNNDIKVFINTSDSDEKNRRDMEKHF